jgi:nitrite reductase/ring-hydroxylating ferredoxin subunit
VEANGRAILLVRQGSEVYAISDVCTHIGGPLSEGKLSDGCVTCPWHGSTFSLADGRVRAGPATAPEDAFEVRVRDGQIELRGRRE